MHLSYSKAALSLLWLGLGLLCLSLPEVKSGNENEPEFVLSFVDYNATWEKFKSDYDKDYSSEEEERQRFSIFVETLKRIENHNLGYQNGQTSYWMKINLFADLTKEEIRALFPRTRSKVPVAWSSALTDSAKESENVPEAIDWREKGFVTPVKDQGAYGTCYSFAATGALEGQWFKKSGSLISLSQQQIVDCSKPYGNDACDGGSAEKTYTYIKSVGGLQANDTYQYDGKDRLCLFNESLAVAKVFGYRKVNPPGDENALKRAVAIVGPIVVAVDASENFQDYGGGVFDGEDCSSSELNHEVVVVGYGQLNGADHWIIKNSWGSDWANEGYMYLARNKGNKCGVASDPVYPLVSETDDTNYDDCKDGDSGGTNRRGNKGSNKATRNFITFPWIIFLCCVFTLLKLP